MWIPHNLLGPLKAESPRETVQASDASTEERMFVVGFLLGNTLTRVWETDLIVAPDAARREIMLDDQPCVVDASTNLSGKLHEIVYTMPAKSVEEAFAATFRHVNGELDRLALQYGRSFEIAGWRIADIVHEARWRCVPFRPSSLIAGPALQNVPAAYGDLMRLYREARNAASATWRLIAAGAILDAAVKRQSPFDAGETDPGCYVLTTDMLVRSGTLVTLAYLKGAMARDLRDVAEPKRRALLSRVMSLGETSAISDTSAYQEAAALAGLANLVDLVTRDLLLVHLREQGLMPISVPEPVDDTEVVSA